MPCYINSLSNPAPSKMMASLPSMSRYTSHPICTTTCVRCSGVSITRLGLGTMSSAPAAEPQPSTP
ncbi:hypothetical protein B0T17DRAFT_541769 [Bombardia bombarda]|uniref:Uncharacterized protein n=1 Tax=Bombardia bombarda TaxID=252184 RepID=A0AA39WD28_9PEZI|nr:hypothetical protein B0T17DRAFT_541769 [Bombardia bombarda]